MIKKIISITITLTILIGVSAFVASSGGITGQTGSPGEGTCGGCHAGGAGITTVSISSIPSFTSNQYVPNQSYTITVTVINSNFNLFGFDCEILNPALNNAGTISNPGAGVQLALFGAKMNATHTAPMGGVGQGSFNFQWQAPANGSITIYAAGNAVNGDASTTGDVFGGTTFTLTSPPVPPTAMFTMTSSICSSVATTMSNSSTGTPPPTYSWSTNPTAIISNSNATNPSITFTSVGIHTVTLFAANNGGTSTVTQTIQVNSCTVSANAAFAITSSICVNGATTMSNTSTGTPTPTYSWTTNPAAVISNSNATNPAITFTNVGTYTVMLLATNGGTSSVSHTITVNSCTTAATAAFSMTSSICTSVITNMTNNSTGAPTPSFTWSVNPAASISNSTATNPTITFTNAGTYSVSLLASNGSSNSVTHTISVINCGVGNNEIASGILSGLNVFPNPSYLGFRLNYFLLAQGKISVNIFDMRGKQVMELVTDQQLPGIQEIDLSRGNLPSGVYLLTLSFNGKYVAKHLLIAQ